MGAHARNQTSCTFAKLIHTKITLNELILRRHFGRRGKPVSHLARLRKKKKNHPGPARVSPGTGKKTKIPVTAAASVLSPHLLLREKQTTDSLATRAHLADGFKQLDKIPSLMSTLLFFVLLFDLAKNVLGTYPHTSPLAMPYVMDVDNSTQTVPTSQWYPALQPSTTSYNLYGSIGMMPRINSDLSVVNGGLPQLGNLTLHLTKLRADLGRLLPPHPQGACLLDWEFWRAEWNYTLPVYQNASLKAAAASLPPGTPSSVVLEAAIRAYEAGCRTFLEASLTSVRAWYPGCLVGVYAYPQNDWSFGGYTGPQAAARRAVNDGLSWLWQASTALFPSIYLTSPGASKYDGQTTEEYVASTVVEAMRCSAMGGPPLNSTSPPPPLVLPLMWYVYDEFPRPTGAWQTLTEGDTRLVTSLPSTLGADALLVWGAVGNPPFTPDTLALYLHSSLGPAMNASFTDAWQCAHTRCSGNGRCMPEGGCKSFSPPSSFSK